MNDLTVGFSEATPDNDISKEGKRALGLLYDGRKRHFNIRLKEIISFFENTDEIEVLELVQNWSQDIKELKGLYLGEMQINSYDDYILGLEEYTVKMFDKFREGFCNVIRSYIEEE